MYQNCKNDESFVGNTGTHDSLEYLDRAGVKYRVGDVALDIHGAKLSPALFRPLFVKKESYNKYNSVMQAQLEAIRRS